MSPQAGCPVEPRSNRLPGRRNDLPDGVFDAVGNESDECGDWDRSVEPGSRSSREAVRTVLPGPNTAILQSFAQRSAAPGFPWSQAGTRSAMHSRNGVGDPVGAVAIGASAGAGKALTQLAAGQSADPPDAPLTAVHMPPATPGIEAGSRLNPRPPPAGRRTTGIPLPNSLFRYARHRCGALGRAR